MSAMTNTGNEQISHGAIKELSHNFLQEGRKRMVTSSSTKSSPMNQTSRHTMPSRMCRRGSPSCRSLPRVAFMQ